MDEIWQVACRGTIVVKTCKVERSSILYHVQYPNRFGWKIVEVL